MMKLIVCSLVDHPEQAEVLLIRKPHTTFEIHVADDDVGKVIGKGGRTARAIRELLCDGSRHLPRSASMNIVERASVEARHP